MNDGITASAGVEVSQWSHDETITGCIVVVLRVPTVVRWGSAGGRPGAREYALFVHAICARICICGARLVSLSVPLVLRAEESGLVEDRPKLLEFGM